ncbi:prepilin-type N-terminal cleavage/methylation domain-containing protein [Brevundimonas sp. PAMC22021]|uniref:prepilin-type N-terminal cleavage/methylation domain-containing protein n=1 Tax=Brevundimonas sp. PAMC22021 TaxID=2861285 RepID=UPI001C628DCD|nr:prepilin-type N-terminal cleavage/methylation domain-containing protein [Brevundimonas sp. PAMC22021]QYF86441.1 prepilin-type N-terminal cleavage/methylation domain-containing protein [Brevundimonas sp. PAMC22021]
MHERSARPGFSLIEALVVLAIGGMALAIIFSIGVKAGDTGFSLGRRAMSAADLDVSISDARSLIRSIALRPPETFNAVIDRPVLARADRLEVDVVTERATQCAPVGWAGRMTLSVQRQNGQGVLSCEIDGRTATLITTSDPSARLSYSTDGVTWSDGFEPAERTGAFNDGQMRSVRLFVRFQGGAIDVLDAAGSGRPESWIRFDDPF